MSSWHVVNRSQLLNRPPSTLPSTYISLLYSFVNTVHCRFAFRIRVVCIRSLYTLDLMSVLYGRWADSSNVGVTQCFLFQRSRSHTLIQPENILVPAIQADPRSYGGSCGEENPAKASSTRIIVRESPQPISV